MTKMPAKEHISITLDEQVLRRVDRLVDGKNTKNRSHAIEKLLSQYLDEQAVKQAVVLCGGHGTTLEPITQEIPKPMIPIKGKPVLEYVINHLKSEGILDIVLAVDYMHDKIISHFGNGSKFGVNIRYVVEQKPLGTAGSLAPLKEMLSDTFVLLYGDILSKVDMQGMLR
ncbi:MAG: NTP transferase domain-containing protein, partial [Candidatus Aenigmarchaeota archaeon]|nr:NTP transferase domain-containing protein [Candidatus Aenigmarchaeota archaeon]